MTPTTVPTHTTTCNICGQQPETPHMRVVGGAISECCVCSCHNEHAHSVAHRAFVRQARRSGISGRGVGFGRGVCGQ